MKKSLIEDIIGKKYTDNGLIIENILITKNGELVDIYMQCSEVCIPNSFKRTGTTLDEVYTVCHTGEYYDLKSMGFKKDLTCDCFNKDCGICTYSKNIERINQEKLEDSVFYRISASKS